MARKAKTVERRESNKTLWEIPVRQITGVASGENTRENALSDALVKAGWVVFPTEAGDGKEQALWPLMTSDDPVERIKVKKLIDENDPDLVAVGLSVMTVGQLEPVEVRDNGKKDGVSSYSIVFGVRRCLAVLYNWIATGVTDEPFVEAKFAPKGSMAEMIYRSMAENNHRKRPSCMDRANAYQRAINMSATVEDIAEKDGCSPETVKAYLKLTTLPPEQQHKLKSREISMEQALEAITKPKAKAKPGDKRRTTIPRSYKELWEQLNNPESPDLVPGLKWALKLKLKAGEYVPTED